MMINSGFTKKTKAVKTYSHLVESKIRFLLVPGWSQELVKELKGDVKAEKIKNRIDANRANIAVLLEETERLETKLIKHLEKRNLDYNERKGDGCQE